VEHSAWLEEDISAQGVVVMRALFDGADPKGNFNPGKILPAAGSAKKAAAPATARKAPAKSAAAK
jgi:hypothetical protein